MSVAEALRKHLDAERQRLNAKRGAEKIAIGFNWDGPQRHFHDGLWSAYTSMSMWLDDLEQEGVDDAEKQGVESRRRTSEPLTSTGGRTELAGGLTDAGRLLFDALDDVALAPPQTTEKLIAKIKSRSPEYALAFIKSAVERSCFEAARALLSSDTGGRTDAIQDCIKVLQRGIAHCHQRGRSCCAQTLTNEIDNLRALSPSLGEKE